MEGELGGGGGLGTVVVERGEFVQGAAEDGIAGESKADLFMTDGIEFAIEIGGEFFGFDGGIHGTVSRMWAKCSRA